MRDGDGQGDQGDGHDRRGDQSDPAGAMVGQATEPPDHRGGGQDEQPGDDVLPQHDGADGGERECCPGPGQRGPDPGQARVGVLVAGAIWYVVAWRLNSRKGVNLGLAYREIPPE